MNRIVLAALKNFWKLPPAWFKLRKYAKHTDEYSFEEKYKHIRYILRHFIPSANIDFVVTGEENIPKEDGFLLCGNHQGIFDISYLSTIPNMTIMAPKNKWELSDMVKFAVDFASPIAIRYPRGRMPVDTEYSDLCSADYDIIGNENAENAIVTYGRLFFNAEKAVKLLADSENVKIIKLNRIKPIPEKAVEAAFACKNVFFFEEGMKGGGVGEKFGCELLLRGFGGRYKLVAVEDEFVAHASVESLMEKYSMSAEKMAALIEKEAAI